MDILTSIFGRKKRKATTTSDDNNAIPLKRTENGGRAANEGLADIFRGRNDEYNLASGTIRPFISIPARLTGCPIVADKTIQKMLLDIAETTNKECLVNGTAWRWAIWSDKLNRIIIEVIPDTAIGNRGIECDPATGEIIAIHTEESITTYRARDLQPQVSTRKRIISRDEIYEEWRGAKNETTTTSNPFGFMPIPFSHDVWAGEWRGTSALGNIIRLIRDNHEIRRNRDQILAQNRPKIIISTDDYASFKKNNTNSDGKITIFENDIVIKSVTDAIEYLMVSGVVAEHTQALEDNRKEIIMGAEFPEIFGGMLATGNYASTDAQITLGVEYIKGIRRELTVPYEQLVNQIAQINAFISLKSFAPLVITWDNLTMTSEATRATIISSYSTAISQLLTNGSVTPEGALFLTKALLPDYPANTADELLSGMKKTLTEFTIPSRSTSIFEQEDTSDDDLGDVI
jgi:hypothetical protein